MSLVQRGTAGDPARLERVLAGLRRYQEAPRPRRRAPRPAVAERRGARLRDYGGSGPPLFMVPSLINPPTVLDLPGRSLLRWLARRGRRVLLLDWGGAQARSDLSVTGHVEQILLPMLADLGEPADLAGYCLGGTMALAAAQAGGARSLAVIAAPWSFGGFAGADKARLAQLWSQSRPVSEQLGLLPMEVLQAAFWSLDPARTVAKFEGFATMEGQAARNFVALEDWANDGPPLGFAAAEELFEAFFVADAPGSGAWRVAGREIDAAALACPVLNIMSRTDRIVPLASAPPIGEPLVLGQGHVGMVVGSSARQLLWRPLAAWLSRVSPT
jgi:polyhydroxyalkanoate synthase subunit PhaC